jgi:transglutaminase-like putative cysteine protease
MKVLEIRHRTTYRYAEPVRLGTHRLMIRPRDSHDLRLLDATLTLRPGGTVRWVHDVFGNSITVVEFDTRTDELEIESRLRLERYPFARFEALLGPNAAQYPFIYTSDERIDLGRLTERHYPDDGAVRDWLEPVLGTLPTPTLDLFGRLNEAVHALPYSERDEAGTRTPAETIADGGTCRDFALLFIEAARELGIGARFVTGYLYDAELDQGAGLGMQGSGATHAWAEIYLPGTGWLEYDPTNDLLGSEHLVRVAAVRDARQASPISGSFSGPPGAFLGMDVEVTVRAIEPDEAPTIEAPVLAPVG